MALWGEISTKNQNKFQITRTKPILFTEKQKNPVSIRRIRTHIFESQRKTPRNDKLFLISTLFDHQNEHDKVSIDVCNTHHIRNSLYRKCIWVL